MLKKYILAIDQGTTGTRAFVFDGKQGKSLASDYQEFRQYFPRPGWVEHDAEEIWQSCVKVIRGVLKKANISGRQIAAIGITNQRETTVLWDRETSKPISRAIVWQCRRSVDICTSLKKKGLEPIFQRKTGLLLDPYFSGTKIKWCLDHLPGMRQRALKGKICFGTIDSWLIWKLTGGKSHVTDVTNASRTLIFNIRDLSWDKEILGILGIPLDMLASVQNSGSVFGQTTTVASLPAGIPIAAVLGDQQAALYGQGCYAQGTIKNTYGTGCFIVLNTGKKLLSSKGGLLTTLASDDQGNPVYALEGSIFIAGAVVQWLRDQLNFIQKSSEIEEAVQGIKNTGGVYFVPAFTGLGAPYWDPQARGLITGLTRGTNRQHIMRAALESIAYQTKDVFDLMKSELRKKIRELRVDGGACRNNFLMQFQADILGCRVIRPKVTESTVQGVAHLAGVTVGLWHNKKDLMRLHAVDRVFIPQMSREERKRLYQGWRKAVEKARLK